MSLKDRRFPAGPFVRTVDGNPPDANGDASSSGGGGGGGAPAAHHTTHESGGTDAVTLAQSQITGLTTDLSAKAPLASPAFTGNPTAPTPTAGDNDTSVATTAFVETRAGLLVPKSLVDAKGDLFVGSANDTVARLAVGSDGQVLTADAASTNGVKWAAPSGGGVGITAVVANPSTSGGASNNTTTWVDVDATAAAIAVTYPASGNVLIRADVPVYITTADTVGQLGLRIGSTLVADSPQRAFYGASVQLRAAYSFVVSGTPGASATYKLAIKRVSGSGFIQVAFGGTDDDLGALVITAQNL